MTSQKLINSIRKNLLTNFNAYDIMTKKLNVREIKNIVNSHNIINNQILWYDADGEDYNNWVDVEAIHYGWIFFHKTKEQTARIIRRNFFRCVNEFKKTCHNRNIIIAENNEMILIVLPMRIERDFDSYLLLRK